MKITCQYCGKVYELDSGRLPPGAKSFKCKGCGHSVQLIKAEKPVQTKSVNLADPKPVSTPAPPPVRPSAPPPPSPDTSPENSLFKYLYRGAFTMLKYNLDTGDSIKAESDAMVAMSPNIRIKGKLEGGIWTIIKRMLSREKIFFQSLIAEHGPGEVFLAHPIPGDIMDIQMDGKTSYLLQKDGFFAGSEELEITSKMQGLKKGLFSGKGFFLVKVSGKGILFVSSYGAIHPIDLARGEEIIVDNYHMVAWPEQMEYTIEKAASGWISSIMSGENLVCRFKGPGRILVQTRNPKGFGSWISKLIPGRSRLANLL